MVIATALPAAIHWIEGALLGTVASGIAILAVAFLGFGMLTGRLDWRTGARVVLGIFILFGAPMIVQGLMSALHGDGSAAPSFEAGVAIPGAPSAPKPAPRSDPFDPYAGTATRR